MSNAVTWTDELAGTVADERTSAVRRAVLLSAFILAATLILSGWVYVYEKQELHATATRAVLPAGGQTTGGTVDVVRHADRLVFSLVALAVIGGGGSLVPLLAAAMTWRRRVISQLQQKASEWQSTASGFQAQIGEIRRTRDGLLVAQAELESQIAKLTATNTTLQEELDKRNRAERALTQRRQELESSKSVLEMHVQARTVQLENLQRRYEMILNAAGEGICGFDLDGKTTFVNPAVAKLTGRQVADLIGKTESEIFLRNADRRNAPAAKQGPGEQFFYRNDGSFFPVEFVKTPINENGRVVGSVLIFKDITERKRVEETLAQKAAELARSNAELEQFAFVASHDLQEPLRKIQAFGDRLKVRCEGVEAADIRDYLDRMQNAAARMRTLINDLLAFSRVIRSSEPFVPIDLAQITKEVLGDLELRIEKTGAKIEVGSLPTIDADPLQMRQLLLNLVGNALKFQPAGNTPAIEIRGRTFSAASGETLAELAVRDNGIGFDEKYVDKIFAVFQRLHGRSEYEGTGVGLAVCRRIVDRHHGSILARSQPGKGATFIVTLPARQAKSVQKAA
jgi:PAS domain S-box-containing protein